jgi:hypothetical protein
MKVRRACEILLRLYPREHRELFGEEMMAVFQQAAEERRGRAWVLKEWIGFIVGAGAAWIAKLTGRSGSVPDQAWSSEVMEARARVELLVSRTVHAIATHDFPGARFYFEEERKAREDLRLLRGKHLLDE